MYLSKLCSSMLAGWQGPLQPSANTLLPNHAACVCNICTLRAKCYASAFKQTTNTISYSEDKAKWAWGISGFRCGHALVSPGRLRRSLRPRTPAQRRPLGLRPLCRFKSKVTGKHVARAPAESCSSISGVLRWALRPGQHLCVTPSPPPINFINLTNNSARRATHPPAHAESDWKGNGP